METSPLRLEWLLRNKLHITRPSATVCDKDKPRVGRIAETGLSRALAVSLKFTTEPSKDVTSLLNLS